MPLTYFQPSCPPIRGAGSRGAVMGDSLTALALNAGDWTDTGYAAFLRRFCGSRISLPTSMVFATLGYTTAQIASNWLPQCLAAKPDWCVVEGGINDLLQTIPPATTIANLEAIYQSLLVAGIFVIAVPIRSTTTPSGGIPPLSATQKAQQGYINNAIKAFCAANSGITYFDVNPSFIDWATGDALAANVSVDQSNGHILDGIHDSPQGAYLFGAGLATVINGLVPARDDRFTLLADTYDPTNNPTGNLLSNGLMAGIGGTVLSGGTGTVPTGWFGDPQGLTVAFGNPAYSGYTNLTKTSMAISGTAASQFPALFSPASGWSVGDTVIAEVEADWNITSNIASIGLTIDMEDNQGHLISQTRDGYISGLGNWPTGIGSAVFRTNPFVIPANTAFMNLIGRVYTPGSGTVAAVVNWARGSMRKIS